MKCMVITLGSHGDVHPFVGLALELQRRGHDVSFVTNGHFRPLAERVGLKFIEMFDEQMYLEGIRNKDLWHRTRGFKTVFRWGLIPTVQPMYELIRDWYAPGESFVVGSSLCMGARIAQEKLGVPMISVHLQPGVMRSLIDPPVLPGLFMPKWMPSGVRRTIFEGGDKYVIDPVLAPVNDFRKTLDLPPVIGFLKDWWHSPLLTIGLWPEWYAPSPADFPKQFRSTGFPLYDESGVHEIDAELERFLDAGTAPIAFTPGSAMVFGHRFFHAAIDACVRLNRRGLLLTRHAEQIPANLPESVRHVSYAPFSTLLPRCAAIVHHGGIGTTAQGLASGVPQLIMPMSHDQPDNAARLHRLGVGDSLRPTFFRGRTVAGKLTELIDDPNVATQAKSLAAKCEPRGIPLACNLIESAVRVKAESTTPP